jgi:dTMP kinase
MFMTFEGGEGSDKTTQIRRLADALEARGHRVWTTREPGGTPVAEVIRRVVLVPDAAVEALRQARSLPGMQPEIDPITPIAELLLMSAARAQHVAAIRHELAANTVVLCDHYADATLAYQGAGRGLDEATVRAVTALATDGLLPDLTVLLDLDPRQGLRRKLRPIRNRLDDEPPAFYERARAAYLALAAQEPERWLVLDATQSQDEIAAEIWRAMVARWPSQIGE